MKIFISYSNKNSDIAFEVCDFLEKNNNHCFIAPRDIRTGFSYAEEIMRGIDSTDILVLLLSAESNDSPHVLREVERAVNARVPIITYKIGEVSLSKSFEYFLMPFQWLEMTADRNHAQLLDAIDILLANCECSDEEHLDEEYPDEAVKCENGKFY